MTPVVPAYGSSTLADLLPGMAAHLGMAGYEDRLSLPASDRYVLVLVDGLGRAQLEASTRVAPHLAGLLPSSGTLTSVAPSTTASALTSLGTGLTPGEHGMAGFSFRHPFGSGVLNALAWDRDLSGLDVQPRLTLLERLAKDGVQVTSVLPAKFEGTGLTEAGLRGGGFVGVTNESDAARRVEQVVTAAVAGDRSLVYCYERALDHTGHKAGWESPTWQAVLAWVDALVASLRAALPADVRLVITGDHGMIDVPRAHRVIAEEHASLAAGVDLIAGEARLRHLYTGEPAAVASRWRKTLGERAWVLTRDEAAEAGWFGWLSPAMAGRFGDVVVAMRDDHAVLTRTFPREHQLVGMHGSLTPAEMSVPLLVE